MGSPKPGKNIWNQNFWSLQITSHFTVQEMVQECDLRKAPTCWGNTTAYDGINLIYAAGNNNINININNNNNNNSDNTTTTTTKTIQRPRFSGHCHAPSCLSMELYNADTGMLLCRHDPVYGKTHQARLFLGNIQDYKIDPTWWGCFWAIFDYNLDW